MPSLEEILENEVLGREYRKGLAEGQEEGKKQGRQEGALAVLRPQIEKRFGPISEAAADRLKQRSAAELESLSLRLLDAASLDELLS